MVIPLKRIGKEEFFEIGLNPQTAEISAAINFGSKRYIFENLQDPKFREIVRNSPKLRDFYEKLAKKDIHEPVKTENKIKFLPKTQAYLSKQEIDNSKERTLKNWAKKMLANFLAWFRI